MIRFPLLPAAPALTLTLAAALVCAAPALARDTRLAKRLFNPDEVVRIEGRMGVQASIAFGEDEHIENVAIGDSTSWQVTPNKRTNLLFVKPLAPRAQTNMTVITDRHTYFFDLVATTLGTPLYVLRFDYPQAPKPAAQAATAPGLTDDEAQAVSGKPAERPVDAATLNFAWRSKGKPALLPARVYDDGMATYLSWAASAPIPAIQVRNEAGVEGPVNFAVRDDVIVIDGVPGLIVLRSGKEVATLENQGPPRPAAAAPATMIAPPLAKGQ